MLRAEKSWEKQLRKAKKEDNIKKFKQLQKVVANIDHAENKAAQVKIARSIIANAKVGKNQNTEIQQLALLVVNFLDSAK